MYYYITILLFCVSQISFSQVGTGMKTSVAIDLGGQFNLSKDGKRSEDNFGVNSADLLIYGPIDHLFDGTMSIATHPEDGEAVFEIHEAFIASDKLIPSSRIKAGQFFLNLGRLGRFHKHEWPFTSTPLIHHEFFGEEGLIDSGAEYSFILPTSFYLDITLGVTSGFKFGHSHGKGEKPLQPNHYIHILSFASFGSFDIQPGLSALARTKSDGQREEYLGIELTGKIKEKKTLTLLVQGEVWQRNIKPVNSPQESTIGGYSLFQYGFANGIELGMRADYVTVSTLKDATGKTIKNYQQQLVPILTYSPSEFSKFRLSMESFNSDDPVSGKIHAKTFSLQSTFILGAHPSHDF